MQINDLLPHHLGVTMVWYGKYEDNSPSLEDRVKKLEKEKRQRERLENQSMTTFMGGSRPMEDEDED
jgi:hypothetical protein